MDDVVSRAAIAYLQLKDEIESSMGKERILLEMRIKPKALYAPLANMVVSNVANLYALAMDAELERNAFSVAKAIAEEKPIVVCNLNYQNGRLEFAASKQHRLIAAGCGIECEESHLVYLLGHGTSIDFAEKLLTELKQISFPLSLGDDISLNFSETENKGWVIGYQKEKIEMNTKMISNESKMSAETPETPLIAIYRDLPF